MTARRKWVPTHEITVPSAESRLTIPVMLVDGWLYQRGEHQRNAWPIWRMLENKPCLLNATPLNATIRRLGRGSDPRGPTRATKRVMINLRPDQYARFAAAAKAAGLRTSQWAVKQLDASVDQ